MLSGIALEVQDSTNFTVHYTLVLIRREGRGGEEKGGRKHNADCMLRDNLNFGEVKLYSGF